MHFRLNEREEKVACSDNKPFAVHQHPLGSHTHRVHVDAEASNSASSMEQAVAKM